MDVRPHPHINLATVTYLFEGELVHRDSLGNHQIIRPGEVNWMTAGSGIAHSERSPSLERTRGARAHGYATDLWTTKRVAAVITRTFGVVYHPAHVSRMLAACGWSCQKPERRNVERDEAAIARWKRYRWAAIKKKPDA